MSANAFITLFSAVPLTLFISVATYVMYSFGLYKMAFNTGLKPAGLAWVPLLRLYTLGQLADRYNSAIEKRSIYRFLLPLLRLAGYGLSVVTLISAVSVYLIGWGGMAGIAVLFAMLSTVFALASRIVELLCYYKTYCDYEPEYCALYLILSILGLEWIPLFLCRNNVPVGIAGHCKPRQPRYNVENN